MTTEAVNALCISAEPCWCFKSLGSLFWIALQVYNSSALQGIYHQKLHSPVFCPGNHKTKAEEVRNTLTGKYPEMKMSVIWCISLVPLTWPAVVPLARAMSALKSIVSCYFQGSLLLVLHIWGIISHKTMDVSGKCMMPADIMHFFRKTICKIKLQQPWKWFAW